MGNEIGNNERPLDEGERLPLPPGTSGVTANNTNLTKRMVAQNWKQVKEVFTVAVRKEPAEREEYLEQACSHDLGLRKEVESLLGSFDSARNFLESPAYVRTGKPAVERQSLKSGQKLDHYEIVKKLGSGGMGEVYLALDSQLNRSVAIKVLYDDVSSSEESRQMLKREACAAATLDHPNICAIFEISESEGRSFIVMQYVEGDTLSEVLENGPMEIEQAIDIGIQIADALEEAHNKRIIHRDIKPSNIIINEKGIAKVLDFGLAKFVEKGPLADSGRRLSTSGAVMGTVPYMSPEQLKGRVLDARTDIFSFGAMLYEMVTGRQAFPEDNHAEAISSILNTQPDLAIVPDGVRAIVQRALMKDKRRRYQNAGEIARHLRFLLDARHNSPVGRGRIWNWMSSRSANTSRFRRLFSRETAESLPQSFYSWQRSDAHYDTNPETRETNEKSGRISFARLGDLVTISALAVALLLAGFIGWYLWNNSRAGDSHSFDSLRSVRLVSWNAGGSSIYKDYSASHDGKMIAYSSNQGGANEGIYIKQTADGKDIRITNDEWNDRGPIWSPNDQVIAFASYRDGRSGIYSCPSFGGNTSLLKIVGDGDLFLRKWSNDSSKIFYEFNGNLFSLDLSTKESRQVTNLPESRSERSFNVSPAETEIVYRDKTDGQSDLWLAPIAGGDVRRLTTDKDEEIHPVWHPDGRRVLYTVVRDEHYQINQVYTDGQAPDQVTRGDNQHEIIDVAGDGSKVFYLTWQDKSDIWTVNAENGEERTFEYSVDFEFWPEASPDGRSVAYEVNSRPYVPAALYDSKIVVKFLDPQRSPISFNGHNPHWLPDSRRIAFVRWSEEEKKASLWIVNLATGEEQRSSENYVSLPSYSVLPYNRAQVREFSWTPDGKTVAYISRTSGFSNILTTAVDSGESIRVTGNEVANTQYYSPFWSRDGKRLAFVSLQRPSEGRSAIWRVWIWEGGAVKEIFSTGSNLRLLGWSDNGDLIIESADVLLKAGPIDLSLVRVSLQGDRRNIAALKAIYATSMTLSADGKSVAFVSRIDDKDDIWIASAVTGSIRKVTANGNSNVFFGSPAFGTDGKTIYFDKQEKLNTISMFENFK